MPPKKNQVVLTEEQIAEETLKTKLRLEALKSTLQRRRELVAGARSEETELREKSRELEEAFQEAKRERFDIISDFTRQFKATEDELIARITLLDSTITDLNDQKELSKLALEETRKERDHYIAMKEREFEEQARKMDEMQEEFRVMLNETQHKMTERVEATMQLAQNEDEEEEDEHHDS